MEGGISKEREREREEVSKHTHACMHERISIFDEWST